MAAIVNGDRAEGREGFEISSQSHKETEAEFKFKGVGLLLQWQKVKGVKVDNINT